jgi:5-methylcytosine-specific restriction endonuclease McrA
MAAGAYGRDWKAFSRALIERRGSRCERCGEPATKKYCLTVHHLDYDPRNRDESNLLVLCSKCHLQVQAGYRLKIVWDGEQLALFNKYSAKEVNDDD